MLIFTNSNLDQAQLKAQEEERQKREAEEKEAQLEKKREEKRLKKMVSSVCLVNCVTLCTFPTLDLLFRTLFSHLHPFSLFSENLLYILAQYDFFQINLAHPPLHPRLG